MISTFRDYELKGTRHFHAHIEVNPAGLLGVDIIEKNEHHQAELCNVSFEKLEGKTRIKGKEAQDDWQMDLNDQDATELRRLIIEANEEFEILMRDL
ncbi:hypothetical protein ACODM8_15745 [Vibrio ostreicida]|uniref:DUF4160 domain-containing protein n=1 Tax=Vibrio ostreicida TaxID=526588 RepID=A0ABT8C0H0_9VIBR|nr:hypothetical protein [Vibrio ostreicida]MDN3612149.1 hypothetical protein [Vibrio ostreicida]NPD08547.1 hypothetical protein [Vibrio ostreicida]